MVEDLSNKIEGISRRITVGNPNKEIMGISKGTTVENPTRNNGNQQGNNGRDRKGIMGTSKRTMEEDRKGIMGISKEITGEGPRK